MTKASNFHKEGYNCAESIIKAYNKDNNKEIPVSLGSGLGTGASVGSLCGAVNGALLVLGYEKGRNDILEKNEAREYSRELMNRVKEKYSSEICLDLKKNKVSCDEIIDFTYEALKELLKK